LVRREEIASRRPGEGGAGAMEKSLQAFEIAQNGDGDLRL
jgi:hypothetical protein